ncbi:M23 family metallopeptidase [Hydrogenibacillus sp. N12]|uniref:M23 family metallopeptidase n=1 Tax=Hydrogenibacillus sp. N12 TaxID=2866627 RepID=UPI001C7D28C5|nr:M23 family metallopeptidase [Hydrogenibacillus sp. N12]QZA32726.1 M23 family metallopeptidase [Hydrogenibacillus sp. N12]
MRPHRLGLAIFAVFVAGTLVPAFGAATANTTGERSEAAYAERMALYRSVAALTDVPWTRLAAVDQFARSLQKKRSDGPIAFRFPPPLWAGPTNPDPEDTDPRTIALFGGLGRDGDGDGFADQRSPLDVLLVLAERLRDAGNDWTQALADLYPSDKDRKILQAFEALYAAFGRLDLFDTAFVVDRRRPYSYTNTWGQPRGFGGRRFHEGADIFAPYGTPVRSATYGVVEVAGWNVYGGWRVGIRDLNNIYYYYAHLSGFAPGVRPGKIVRPGEVIGYVGSSGYGPPGTQGKFPPHLHFGMYKYDGRREWAFDPTPHLRRFERLEREKARPRERTGP